MGDWIVMGGLPYEKFERKSSNVLYLELSRGYLQSFTKNIILIVLKKI